MSSPADRPPSVDRLARSLADIDLPHPLLVDAARSAIAAGDPDDARRLANETRRRLLVPVINGTGPHAQEAVYAGARVLVKPATPGTGVIAGGAMRAVLESAGIKDVRAKSLGSSNTQNVVKATFKALTMMRSASDVADLRGISVHRVFNG